ncbi:hypothetical protein OHW24_16085 [Acinetobacter baumannii]|nr:hypothetical protein [Acinetobacter baumannii]
MKKYRFVIKSLITPTLYISGLTQSYAELFSKEDKNAECYVVKKGIPTSSEHCKVIFSILNDDGNSAVTIYKNQIFRMVSYIQCDSNRAESCYVENETLAFGHPKKTNELDYLFLKEEDAQTYYRNHSKQYIHVTDLFIPIDDSWATCMKSKTYDFCIQSKYSIEKNPKLRNEF